jgi:D-tyrosyl-tRNA(Tyr) deacylase
VRVVVQVTKNGKCEVDGIVRGHVDYGYMLLVGFTNTDTLKDIEKVCKKINGLRIFPDEFGKINKSLSDIKGTILSISQFTLYADVKKGNRPSFTCALEFDKAKEYYKIFNDILKNTYNLHVEEGIFGGDMFITFTNCGPTTIIIDSKDLV